MDAIPLWAQFAVVICSPAFAAGGAYYAVKVHLQWLRRDVDDVRSDVKRALAEVDRAHTRIDGIVNMNALSTQKLQALARLRS